MTLAEGDPRTRPAGTVQIGRVVTTVDEDRMRPEIGHGVNIRWTAPARSVPRLKDENSPVIATVVNSCRAAEAGADGIEVSNHRI